MEDFMGILVFLVFLGISLVGRFLKAQKGQQEQWPGPVAKGPGTPRETPKTTWAPPAPPQQQPRRQQPQLQPRKEPPKTLVSREEFGSEGVWSGEEGPGSGERVSTEMNRFARESEQMERRSLGQLSDDLGGRKLEFISDDLVRPEDEAPGVTVSDTPAWNLQPALGSKDSLAQAVILSEVLGKPRAMRKGHRV